MYRHGSPILCDLGGYSDLHQVRLTGKCATWAGLVLSPGGVVTMVMMFVVGRLAAKVQPKYLIVAGVVLIALSMCGMTNVYTDLGFWFMARSWMLLGR
jgi:MFS transporter, DHA2 family, multidrug resistance protein